MIAAAILIGAVVLATMLVSTAPEPERREPPSQIPYVETATVAAGSGAIPVRGAGTVRPRAEVTVAAQVGGRVVHVNPAFVSGRRVAAGETLFRIDEQDYGYRLREAEASLAARQADYLLATAEALLARAEYKRYASREGDPADGSAADAAPREENAAHGQHSGGQAAPANPLTLREPQLKAAGAALDREEARVADAQLALSRTRVTAPFDGIVLHESVDAGQLVTAGASVGRLVAADAFEVVVPLSDVDVALIPGLWQPRAKAAQTLRVPAEVVAEYGEARYRWQGHVDRAEAALDAASRTIDVVVRVPDPFFAGQPFESAASSNGSPPLLIGKYVEVAIQGSVAERYFRFRRAALQPGNEIWVVDNGAVRIVPVRILQRGDDEVFVTGALAPGQAAIIGGLRFATDGMRVRTAAPTAQ